MAAEAANKTRMLCQSKAKLNNAKATLEQETKDAEADQELADADTEDFAKVMENNIGHENSTFADNNVANFVASSGETKADEVYQRYKDVLYLLYQVELTMLREDYLE